MKPTLLLTALLLTCPLAARNQAPAATEGEKISLDPFRVHGTATSNFAIDIQIFVGAKTGKVANIEITRVAENSDAADRGVQAGDEIVNVNGVPVEGMDPHVDKDSPIGRIFLNRTPGDLLKLELLGKRTQEVALRALPLTERIVISANTKDTVAVFVKRVEGNAADAGADLRAGDEILTINGVPLNSLDPKADLDHQLAQIVVNRPAGEDIKLELSRARTQKVTLRALRPLEFRPAGNKWD